MNKKYFPFIIVTIVSLLLSILYCPPYDLYFDDKEIFKYTGLLIKRGGIPYIDFFDHKPPLIFFLNYLGAILGTWGLWVIDAALVLFSSIQFLKINIKFKIYFPVILPILFNLVLRNNHISLGFGMTREYTTIFLLLAFCTIANNTKFKYFYLGLLSALIFFMQQDQVIILIPFIIYTLFTSDPAFKKLLNKITYMLLGVLTIIVPIIVYFGFNNALKEFWQNAFLFNFQWYTSPDNKPGIIKEIIAIKGLMYVIKFDIIILATLFLMVTSFFIGNNKKWLLIASFFTIPLSLISEFLTGNLITKLALCNYYFFPFAATLPFAIFIVFAFTKNQTFNNKAHQFIYGCLFFFNLILSLAEHTANFYRYPQNYIATSAEIKYLDQSPPADYQLYVFNNSNYIYAYNKYHIKAPSKWLYHYFWNWYKHWDKDNLIIESIITDLKKHRTKYIINYSNEQFFKQKMNYTTWKSFIDTYYVQLKPLHLWQLKQ